MRANAPKRRPYFQHHLERDSGVATHALQGLLVSSRCGPKAQQLPRFAQILRSRVTSVAVSATHQCVGHDSLATATTPNQFVATNQGRTPQSTVPQKSGNVGAADPSNLDRNFLFPVLGFGPGTLFQFDLAGSGIDQSAHRPKYKAAFVPPIIALVIFLTG
jgi:hypothetical protein